MTLIIDLATLFTLQPKPELGKPSISPAYDPSSLVFLENIHRRKSEGLKNLIVMQGWPSAAIAGEHAEAAAFMIAQHSDYDPDFQRLCHVLMLASIVDGTTSNLGFLAFLTDRILCNEGRHQRFGTQIREVSNGCFVPKPIEFPELVDTLREQGQLQETLSDYLQRVNNGDLLLFRRVLNGYAEELEYAKEHKVVPLVITPH